MSEPLQADWDAALAAHVQRLRTGLVLCPTLGLFIAILVAQFLPDNLKLVAVGLVWLLPSMLVSAALAWTLCSRCRRPLIFEGRSSKMGYFTQMRCHHCGLDFSPKGPEPQS